MRSFYKFHNDLEKFLPDKQYSLVKSPPVDALARSPPVPKVVPYAAQQYGYVPFGQCQRSPVGGVFGGSSGGRQNSGRSFEGTCC